jgi:hypothetical protein
VDIVPLLDRDDLVVELDRLGIDRMAYSLDGGLPGEKYCLEDRRSEWAVYYSERGLRTGERIFATEDAAARYLLGLLRHDPTARVERNGPLVTLARSTKQQPGVETKSGVR